MWVESKNIQRDPQMHDSTEFYVQGAIKFVHEHDSFRWKPLKGNGRGRKREGKERGQPGYFSQYPSPQVPSYATAVIMCLALL